MGHVPDHVVDEALSLIQNESELPHPLGPLLKSFISEALQPRLAAAHVLQRCRHNDDQKAALIALISDWMYIVESSKMDFLLAHMALDLVSHKLQCLNTVPRHQQ